MWTIDDVLKRLDSIQALGDDWDSYGSPAPDEAAIAAARGFIRTWPGPVPGAGPGIARDVEFEWEQGGLMVLLQFRPDGSLRLHAFDRERTLVELEDCAARASERAVATVQSLLLSGTAVDR